MITTTKSLAFEVLPPASHEEEMLVADERGAMRPSELVERKLVAMLKSETVPISQLHQTRRIRGSLAKESPSVGSVR